MAGAPPFDFSSLQQALNDPSIKQMAEQIANDPSFKEVTKQLQESFAGMMGPDGAPAGGAGGLANMMGSGGLANLMQGFPGANAAGAGGPPGAGFDPSQYMNAVGGMFQNPAFMQMAEKLGKSIIESDPGMANMMKTMQDPEYKNKVEDAMKNMKENPELKPMLDELETGGPMAMMKYWNDPDVLAKLSKAMGGQFAFPGMPGVGEGEEGEEEEEEGEGEGEVDDSTVHGAASAGDVEKLKALLEAGGDVDSADEEGRTALHFACGYGEIECAKVLIEGKAKLDAVDNNKNTALHYAAGYGQAESVKLLVDSGADKSALNADGKTALEVAELNEQTDVIAVLTA